MAYNIRNKRYNKAGTIDLEWEHPEFGWIDITTSSDDVVDHCRELYTQALEEGNIAAYTPPSAEEVRASMPSLTRRQLRLGLLTVGVTSAQVTAVIAAMPAGMDKEVAQIEWEDASTFNRTHPLIASVGAALGLSDTHIDTLWAHALTL